MTNPGTIQAGYQVRELVDAAQLKSDLAFSTLNLSEAMMTQASMFSYYGVLSAQASKQVDTVKLLLETTEAAVYSSLRASAVTNSQKLTETQLENSVARHERVIAMKKALTEARHVESVAKTAVEAFRHKRDMLIQVGLISREEMKGDLRINAPAREQSIADVYEAQKARMREAQQKMLQGGE